MPHREYYRSCTSSPCAVAACPPLQGDPDIAGIGVISAVLLASLILKVIIAFLGTAGIPLLASIVTLSLNALARWSEDDQVTYNFRAGRVFATSARKIVQSWIRSKTPKFMEKLILGFSDQQLMTGLGILLVAFVRLPKGQISAYHFVLAVNTAWFSANTHLITLTVLSPYLKKSSAVRNCRISNLCHGVLTPDRVYCRSESTAGEILELPGRLSRT